MAEQQGSRSLFRVGPTRQAIRESQLGKGLFNRADERAWVLQQLRLLRHWPPDAGAIDADGFQVDLDVEKIHHGSVEFFEFRLRNALLRDNTPLRVFFAVHDASRSIWVVGAYWKKTQRIENSVKTRMARRVRDLLGGLQDGDHAQ